MEHRCARPISLPILSEVLTDFGTLLAYADCATLATVCLDDVPRRRASTTRFDDEVRAESAACPSPRYRVSSALGRYVRGPSTAVLGQEMNRDA